MTGACPLSLIFYVLYWAVEDDKVAQGDSLIVSNAISNADQQRVKRLLEVVVTDGRIVSVKYNLVILWN